MQKKLTVDSLEQGLTLKSIVYNDKYWFHFHQHPDDLEMVIHTKGPVIYSFGRNIEQIQHTETILYWGAIPHQVLQAPEGTELLFLSIPLKLFVQMELTAAFKNRVLSGEILKDKDVFLRQGDELFLNRLRSVDYKSDSAYRKALIYWTYSRFLMTMKNCESDSINNEQHDTHLSLQDISGDQGPGIVFSKERKTFMFMYQYILENYLDPISVKEIAEKTGIDSNYASALFHKQSGMNIIPFINMLRLYKAKTLLLTTDLKIIDIALESGFGSVSTFYYAFSRMVHESPSEYRRNRLPLDLDEISLTES